MILSDNVLSHRGGVAARPGALPNTVTLRGALLALSTLGAAVAAVAAPAQTCPAPIAVASTDGAFVVGMGNARSCTAAALQAAITASPVVVFRCGKAPMTIFLNATLNVPSTRNTVIDGGGLVTLDGSSRVRIMSVDHPDYRSSRFGLTLQHITLANGKASGNRYVPPTPTNASCSFGWADGGGGAIYLRDSVFHAFDVTFRNNTSASPGPDVAGGAVYAVGSLDVTIVGSTFIGNSGSNGGAVGLLQSDGRFANNLFQGNKATGTGANYVGGDATGCGGVAQPNQGGSGGNGGAVVIDGSSDGDQTVCGSTFLDNTANEFAGALFRTADTLPRLTSFDRSLFQGNQAKTGGALYVQNANPLVITASTFAGNSATGAGAAQLIADTPQITNTTFSANVATLGVGGALMLIAPGADGWIRNVTFSDNRSSGGPGYFSAAIFGTPPFPVDNTVFANNLSADAGSPMQCGFVPALGSNDVQWPQQRPVGGLNDNPCVVGARFVDPQLGALGAYGGATPTLTPGSSSPLRGAGRNCPATDQRGVARNTAQCTIGAVE